MDHSNDHNPFLENEDGTPVRTLPSSVKLTKTLSFYTPKGEFEVSVSKSDWDKKLVIAIKDGVTRAELTSGTYDVIPAIKLIRGLGGFTLYDAKSIADEARAV